MANSVDISSLSSNITALSEEEYNTLRNSFNFSLVDSRSDNTETIDQMMQRYGIGTPESMGVIDAVAAAAKKQFNGNNFGGTEPSSSQFGISKIRSGYFGWNDWSNLPTLTAGTDQTWLDASTPDNLSGTSGQPLKVGQQAVHLIMGLGSYDQSPKITAEQFTFNEQTYPTQYVGDEFRNTDLRVRWLDSPWILEQNDNVNATVYPGLDGDDVPYLVGVTFINNEAARILDPSGMTGQTNIVYQ